MACRLLGVKPLSKPMLRYCQLDPQVLTSVKFESKYKIFIHENAFENIVSEMAAILSREERVNAKNVPPTDLIACSASTRAHAYWFLALADRGCLKAKITILMFYL